MRKLMILVLVVTLIVAGLLAGQALYAWEWSRAVWMTTGFVAVEVALVGVLVLGRLKDLVARIDSDEQRDPVRHRLVESRPAAPDRFAWLQESMGRTNVFVTMIIGGGVIVSGVLWIIDQIARRTVTTTREGRLADDLHSIAPPRDGLVPPEELLFAEDLSSGERDDLWLLLTGRHGPHPAS
jgi:hypothetical protein